VQTPPNTVQYRELLSTNSPKLFFFECVSVKTVLEVRS
jgi:hypothetical protein